jgi:hypothetical protein
MARPRKEVKSAARTARMVPGGTTLTNIGTRMRGMTPGQAPAAPAARSTKPQEAYTATPDWEKKYRGGTKQSSKVEMRRKGIRADR